MFICLIVLENVFFCVRVKIKGDYIKSHENGQQLDLCLKPCGNDYNFGIYDIHSFVHSFIPPKYFCLGRFLVGLAPAQDSRECLNCLN